MLQVVYKEVRGLHQAAYILGLFAFGSQLLALVRDRLLAHQFGAGMELDLYYAAFRIPDLLYVLFASTLSVYVLIPFVASRIKGDDSHDAQRLLSQIFSGFLLVYSLLAVLMYIAAPYILPYLFPGLSPRMDELVGVMRILLLQPLLLGVSSLFGVVTQLGHRFILYAISPLIYNVGIIVGIVFFFPIWGLNGLALGVVCGALGHLLVQVPLVRKSSLAFTFTKDISWILLWSVLRISLPRALTLAMQQLSILALLGFASVMTVGSVSVFQFAYNLQSVPLAVIGASYSIAAFPFLADLFAQKKMDAFAVHMISAFRHIIFWSVPAIALLIVLRAHVVRVVLGSGAFNWSDTRLTSAVLAVLAVSLVAQALNLLIVRAFYAGGKTVLPLVVTTVGSLCTMLFVYLLYVGYLYNPSVVTFFETVLRIENVPGSEIIVLGIGYSTAMCLQTAVLLFLVMRTFSIPSNWFFPSMARAIVASCIGGFAAYTTLNIFATGINDTAFLGILIQGASGGVVGIGVIIVAYHFLRSPELQEVYRSFHKRLFKTDIVASEVDVL